MLEPFVPQIYSIGSRTRFRGYGTPYVRTPIPGAGFKGRRMYYEKQPLMLGLGNAAPPRNARAARAHGLLLDPSTRFVVLCRGSGRRPRIVRGLKSAINKARANARRHRRYCDILLPGATRGSIVPIVLVDPTGAIVERSGRAMLGGLGQDVDPGRVATVVANLLIDPERELSRRGEALAQALDRHVATPLVESMGRQMQPYFWRYVFPPLLVLYAITSIAAIKAWQAEARLAGRG